MIIIKGKYTIISHTRFIHLVYLYPLTVSLRQMTSSILRHLLLMGLRGKWEVKRSLHERSATEHKSSLLFLSGQWPLEICILQKHMHTHEIAVSHRCSPGPDGLWVPLISLCKLRSPWTSSWLLFIPSLYLRGTPFHLNSIFLHF